MRFSPCCCCSVEAGVYVLLFFNLLYIAALIVFSVGFSSWTLSKVIYESPSSDRHSQAHHFLKKNTTEYKTVLVIIWISYLIYFAFEVLLGLFLLKAINTSDCYTGRRLRRWVILRTVLIICTVPFVILHSYLHYQIYGIVIIGLVAGYHLYYMVVVSYYAHEIDVEFNTTRMCNSMKCRVCLTYTRASKRPLTIQCDNN